MSCFEGIIEELKNVSVDFFENKNLYSTTYFLSHCHSDHMEGLRSYTFLKRLREEPRVFLYCSEITAHILKSEGTFIDVCHKIKELPIGLGSLITIPDTESEEEQEVTVTLIPTGHCPGAVMFLFEADIHIGRILYTGDFRILIDDAPKFKQLLYSNGTVKEIEKLYLDTTFFSHQYKEFPARKDSMAIMCDFVALWLDKGHDHHAIIQMPAKYGSEAVFMTLAKQLGMKIHVKDEAYSIFKNVSEIRDAVTNDPMSTRIHACLGLQRRPFQKNGELSLLPCRVDWFKLLIIRPCALSFTSDVYNGTKESAVLRSKEEENLIRVCYSCHSSNEELKYFVKFLKPKQLEACVVPPKMNEVQTLRLLRNLCLPIYGKDNMPVLTVSKRKATTPSNASPKVIISKKREIHVEDEMDFAEKSRQKNAIKTVPSQSVSNLKTEVADGEARMDVVEMEENAIEMRSVPVRGLTQSDADIYRLIAQDLQPNSGDQDSDVRQSIALAFMTAANEQKPFVFN